MKHGRKSPRAKHDASTRHFPATGADSGGKSGISPRDWGLAALLVLSVIAAYWPALQGGMVWDDDSHLTPATLRSWEGLLHIWTRLGATQQYYPLLHSAFWVEHKLWGDAVTGYHLVNVLQHVTSALLLVAFCRRLKIAGGWIAAFIFVLHPVAVESVAWMSEQKNTLSTVFCLGAAWVYLDFDETRNSRSYGVASVCFVLALLSKTVVATLPASLLVLIWWRRGKIELRRDVLPLLPWLLGGIAAGLFTAWVERVYIGANGGEFSLTLTQRGLLASRAVCFYFSKLVWPTNLTFIYPRWTIDAGAAWQYVFPALAIGALALLAGFARARRGPLAAFLIYGGTLFPVLGFVNVFPFQYSYVADHFQYAATLALIVPLGWGLATFADRATANTRGYFMPGIGALLLVLACLTFQQARSYGSATALYEQTLARNPDCWLAQNNLGNLLARSPDTMSEAITHLEAAVRLKPGGAYAQNNLANALVKVGRVHDALPHYEAALSADPTYVRAHKDFGATLAGTPDGLAAAVTHFEAALSLNPNDEETHNSLGTVLIRLPGQTDRAIQHFQEAIRIAPNFVQARNNLAAALVPIPGKFAEAKAQVEETLRIDPNYASAHYTLALMLIKESRLGEAHAELTKAVELNPNFTEARDWLSRFHH